MKSIKIRLHGGLGNQLFQIAAGVFLKQDKMLDVTFKTRNSKHLGHDEVRRLDLGIEIEKEPLLRLPFLNRVENLLVRKLPVFAHLRGIYWCPEVGWQSDLEFLSQYREIVGYFQSWKYATCIREKIRLSMESIKLKPIAQTLIHSIENKNCVSIHIRRGDYQKNKNTIGLLSRNYFANSLELASKISQLDTVYVFSDDVHEARQILDSSNAHLEVIYVDEGKFFTPLETMCIMSKFSRHIISNSTFSWWSAYLSDEEYVIRPSEWFAHRPDPVNLFPLSWHPISSHWT